MALYTAERVLEVRHWSDALFSFSTTRQPGLRFENGQFIMLGLDAPERRIVRAYSIASANYEDQLQFYSIKVPGGPLTSRLQHILPGSELLVSSKPTGTLVLRDLKPGRRLFLLATGTGVAPFLSIIKDPATYEAFPEVYLVRGARATDGLQYADHVIGRLRTDPDLGEIIRKSLIDYRSVTQEQFPVRGRITALIASGRIWRDLCIPAMDPATDRCMVCGSMRMIDDVGRMLDSLGLEASPRVGVPGDYVIERAFVEACDGLPRQMGSASLGGVDRGG